jgi:hypothetical protein
MNSPCCKSSKLPNSIPYSVEEERKKQSKKEGNAVAKKVKKRNAMVKKKTKKIKSPVSERKKLPSPCHQFHSTKH